MATETGSDVASHGETADVDGYLHYGSTLMALAFAGLGAFGVVLAVRIAGGQGVIESGVDIGTTTAELAAFNPALPHYIAHVRMAVAGMFVGLAVLGVATAWYGVRRGQRWAWTASVVALVVGTAVGVPMHYSGAFHVDQVRHLGPAYASLALFVAGAALAFRGFRQGSDTR